MRSFVKKFFYIFLICTIPLDSTLALAEDDNKIRVRQITPELANGYLKVSVNFENLFSDRIVGTIQSGLPSIIQIEIKLYDSRNKSIFRKLISKTISYDIWEERYSIKNADTSTTFTEFEEVKHNGSRLRNETLTESKNLDENSDYTLRIRVGIIPISARQAEKVTDWLLDPNQTEEYLASENRSSGWQLNINKLVSFFVSSRKKSHYTSEWYSSSKFRIRDLE